MRLDQDVPPRSQCPRDDPCITASDPRNISAYALKARRPRVDESGRETMHDDNDHRIHHHVQLPGGRQIEVVYLESNRKRDDGALQTPPLPQAGSDTSVTHAPWSGSSPTSAPGEALHVCPRCAGGLVSPLEWGEESPGRWQILMRCPDCDLVRDGVFGQALVERLDEELDRATAPCSATSSGLRTRIWSRRSRCSRVPCSSI